MYVSFMGGKLASTRLGGQHPLGAPLSIFIYNSFFYSVVARKFPDVISGSKVKFAFYRSVNGLCTRRPAGRTVSRPATHHYIMYTFFCIHIYNILLYVIILYTHCVTYCTPLTHRFPPTTPAHPPWPLHTFTRPLPAEELFKNQFE